MAPADILCYARVRSQGGEETQAFVERSSEPPISRETAFHMILAASLLLEEAEWALTEARDGQRAIRAERLARRMELLRLRLSDAINREDSAKAVIASRPVLPTVEDAE